MAKAILAALAMMAMVGCTDNQRARSLGGTAHETLPAGKKLVVATWKGDSLWLLTRAARQGEHPETYEFKESSSFGIMQGSVVITETK